MHYQFKIGKEMTCNYLDMVITEHLFQKLNFFQHLLFRAQIYLSQNTYGSKLGEVRRSNNLDIGPASKV